MRFVWNKFFLLIPPSSIPSVWQGNDAGRSRIVAARGHLWSCKTSTLCGRSCHSLRSFCLTIVTTWTTTRANSGVWPTGLSARTLIGEQSTAIWLNMALDRQERKEALMRIRIQVIIEADQEATPLCVEEVA